MARRHRLILRPDKKRVVPKGQLRMGLIRKYDQWALDRLVKRVRFPHFPVGIHIEADWINNARGHAKLHLDVRIGIRDINNRRRLVPFGLVRGALKLPPGRFLSEAWLLSLIRRFIIEELAHELDEHMLVDGHRVFDPHTRTGRNRVRI